MEESTTQETEDVAIPETEELTDSASGETTEETSQEKEIIDLIVFYDHCGLEELSMIDEEIEKVLKNIRVEKYDAISAEAGNALISVLENARELYYIACMNNGYVCSIDDVEDLMKKEVYQKKYMDYPLWLAEFYEHGGIFDSHTYDYGINCVAEAIVEIGEDIPLCENEITTENQKYAMKLAKKMVKVFYEHERCTILGVSLNKKCHSKEMLTLWRIRVTVKL